MRVVSVRNGIRFNKFISKAHCFIYVKYNLRLFGGHWATCTFVLCTFFPPCRPLQLLKKCMKNDYVSRRLERYIGYIEIQLHLLHWFRFSVKTKKKTEIAKILKFMICCFSYCRFFAQNFFLLFIVYCMKQATKLYRIGNISFLCRIFCIFFFIVVFKSAHGTMINPTRFTSFDFTLSTKNATNDCKVSGILLVEQWTKRERKFCIVLHKRKLLDLNVKRKKISGWFSEVKWWTPSKQCFELPSCDIVNCENWMQVRRS